jgi:hypothetical protein
LKFLCFSLFIRQHFATFLKVMLTKHPQNESNVPRQNALKLTYGNVKIKKISGGIPPDSVFQGKGGRGRRGKGGEGRGTEGELEGRERVGMGRGEEGREGEREGGASGRVTWLEGFLTLK